MPSLLAGLARIAALVVTGPAAVACSAHTAGAISSFERAPELEADLSLTIDRIDVRHGALRISATMEDGSPDVSILLGPTCDSREVGHGIATRVTFTWNLTKDELARAIECSLVVKVRAVDDDGRRIRRQAAVPVGVILVADEAVSPRFMGHETHGPTTRLTFTTPTRATRIAVGGGIFGAEDDGDDEAAGTYTAHFLVGNDDLAHAVLARRALTVQGTPFPATVSIANLTLDVTEPTPTEDTGDG